MNYIGGIDSTDLFVYISFISLYSDSLIHPDSTSYHPNSQPHFFQDNNGVLSLSSNFFQDLYPHRIYLLNTQHIKDTTIFYNNYEFTFRSMYANNIPFYLAP